VVTIQKVSVLILKRRFNQLFPTIFVLIIFVFMMEFELNFRSKDVKEHQQPKFSSPDPLLTFILAMKYNFKKVN